MKILSIDCGNKSFTWVYMDIHEDKLNNICEANARFRAGEISPSTYDVCANIFTIIEIKSVDLIPGQKVSETSLRDRSALLKGVLLDLKTRIDPATLILVEYQPPENQYTPAIFHQLVFFFSSDYKIIFLPGSQKNALDFDNIKPSLKIKYKKRYDRSKELAKSNVRFIERAYDISIIRDVKNNQRDISDAFMQAFAWIFARGEVNM